MAIPSLPALPSDSLYKFSFIGSILMLLLGIYLIVQDTNDMLSHEMEFYTTTYKTVSKNEYLDTLYRERYARYDSIYNTTKDGVKRDILDAKLSNLSDKIMELGDTQADYEAIEKMHKSYHTQKYQTLITLVILCVIAFSGMVYGYINWLRQQKLQDSFLSHQYELQKIEVEIKKIELSKKIQETRNGILLENAEST